jgi:hypothetical protein
MGSALQRPNHTPLWMMMNHTNNNRFAWMMKMVLIIIMHSECNKEWKVESGFILQFGVRGCHFDLREREEDVLPCLAPLTHCT